MNKYHNEERHDAKYDIVAKSKVLDLLSYKNLEIPYNQRHYDWEKKHVVKYHEDLIDGYNDGKYKFYSLGDIIMTDMNNSSIWDGQQRVTTTILYIYALIVCCRNRFSNMGNDNEKNIRKLCNLIYKEDIYHNKYEKKIYDEINKEKNRCGSIKLDTLLKVPKLRCVCVNDNYSLIYLLNGVWKSLFSYMEQQNKKSYKCTICEKIIGGREKTRDHLLNTCLKKYYGKFICKKYKTCHDGNKILDCYDTCEKLINAFIDKYNNDFKRVVELCEYLTDIVMLNIHRYHDNDIASQIFDRLNNRGKKLGIGDINRNILLRNIDSYSKQNEYYNIFDKFSNEVMKIGITKDKNNVVKLCCEMINEELSTQNCTKIFENLIKNGDPCEVFDDIYNKFKFIKKVKHELDKYPTGQVIYDYNWELMRGIIVPFYYKYNTDVHRSKIVNALSSFVVRIQCFGNPHIYKTKNMCVALGNDIFNETIDPNEIINRTKKMCNEICDDNKINKELFLAVLCKRPTTLKKANIYLKYDLSGTTTIGLSDYNKLQIEHITPINGNKDNKYIEYLGNKTLLEGSNSINQKGNMSLHDQSYVTKRGEYKKSSVQHTRNIGENNSKWSNKEIKLYTETLANRIWTQTEKMLKIQKIKKKKIVVKPHKINMKNKIVKKSSK